METASSDRAENATTPGRTQAEATGLSLVRVIMESTSRSKRWLREAAAEEASMVEAARAAALPAERPPEEAATIPTTALTVMRLQILSLKTPGRAEAGGNAGINGLSFTGSPLAASGSLPIIAGFPGFSSPAPE